MFETLDDTAVVEAIGASAREENAGCARRLAAIGELYARRAPEDDVERENWAIDGYANVVAEVAAELGVSRGRAAGQLRYAIALRDDLPRVAEVFATGAIDMRMVSVFVTRTELIMNPDLMAKLDVELAARAPRWTRLSKSKLIERVDWLVAQLDATGVRAPAQLSADRFVDIEPTQTGMASVWANLHAPDGAVLDRRLDAMAATVCADDPRTDGQRRADALGALAAGQDQLTCQCGFPDCAAPDRPRKDVCINVLAEQTTLTGESQTPAYLPGFGPLPAEQLRELAATATVKPLAEPAATPEPRYRPSTALAEFVRARDLTCRFPGCDKPAQVCDIDHTIPFQVGGPTHPSNLKLLCRAHHLLKTFYTGPRGWADQQLPDGSVIWTAPSGCTYTTTPDGGFFFPQLAVPTGDVIIPPPTAPLSTARGLSPASGRCPQMPTRKRTRAQNRRYRIDHERRMNELRIAEERRKYEAWLAATYEPPPF